MYSSVPGPPQQQWNPGPAGSSLDRNPSSRSPPPASPTSPTRSGRLRGLSYLRTYTQTHILSRDSHNNSSNSNSNSQRPSTLARTTSYPAPMSISGGTAPAAPQPAPQNNPRQTSPTAQRSTTDLLSARSSTQDNLGSTSGWLPTVGGQSGVSRIATEPQSTATDSSSAVLSGNSESAVASDLTASMARTRPAIVIGATDTNQVDGGGDSQQSGQNGTVNGSNGSQGMAHQLPSIRFCAHQDPRAQRPSLVFSPITRILPTGKEVIKVGRYSERDNQPPQATNTPSAAPVGFKSKVVSRRHCEFWCAGGRWFIKDVKSSSGTFLNHIRLSSPGTESRPFPVNDGDIVQLGIDFKGGEEMIFRCVKIRVELNKGWQNGPSSFNVQSHKRLRELNNLGKPPGSGSSQDCSICLGPIAPCQSLFVAPCSHTWHYKCIRIIINGPHWPHFICPNCRSVADLEAELDDPSGNWDEVDPAEATIQTPQTTEPPQNALQSRGQVNSSEGTGVLVEPPESVDSQPHRNGSGTVETAEGSDDSSADDGIRGARGDLSSLHINDESPSPSDSESPAQHTSNATVAPLDIISRKPVPGVSIATSSHLEQPNSHMQRTSTRTPSPNGLSSSVGDALVGVEGPMTPRNDAGPFIFDGSAGRGADVQLAALATMNLTAAAVTPLPETPQSAA